MIKQTRTYLALASLFVFCKMLVKSIYMNMAGRNNRERTDTLAKEFGQQMLAAVGAHLQVKGTPPALIPGRPYILISNHASHFDIPAVYAALPYSIRMITKKELFDIPFFGPALTKHEYIKIDRQNRHHALSALQAAKKLMESGIVIWAAAEGTRSRTGELLPFKKGIFILALEAEAIIIPMTIHGTHDILPAKTWDFSAGKTVTVTVGEPIDTQGMGTGTNSRDALMSRVRTDMERQLER